jgi:hypothetical protein
MPEVAVHIGRTVKQRVCLPSSRFNRISSIRSIWFRRCFEIASYGPVWRRMDSTLSKAYRMAGVVTKTGEFSRPNAGRSIRRSWESWEENGAAGISKFVTPFTPLTCDFGEISKTRWFSMVRMYAMDAEVLYLQMTSSSGGWHSSHLAPVNWAMCESGVCCAGRKPFASCRRSSPRGTAI